MSSVGAGSDFGGGVRRAVGGRGVTRGELGRGSGTPGADDTLGGAAGSSEGGGAAAIASGRGEETGTDGDEGTALNCDGRALGTSGGTLGPPSARSGRPTTRRFTTVGWIRSSTIDELFCFSMCRRTRSTSSVSTELMWLRTSPNPIDWNKATSAFCSMPSSFATS